MFKLTGRVHVIEPKEFVKSKDGSKTYEKQKFVLDTGAKYNPYVSILAFGKPTEQLSRCRMGDTITVMFEVSSREFKGKWYTEVNASNIEGGSADKAVSVPVSSIVEDDLLPF